MIVNPGLIRNKGGINPSVFIPLIGTGFRGVGDLSFVRSTPQWGTNDDGTLTKVDANVPFFNSKGFFSEPTATNVFLNSAAPVTQNISLTTGAWTLTVWGAGTVTTSNGTGTATGNGATTSAATRTITVTGAGTITFTVSGADATTKVNVENTVFGTSFIQTAAGTAARALPLLTFPTSGNLPANNFTIYLEASMNNLVGLQTLFSTYIDGNNFFTLWYGASAGNMRLQKYVGGAVVGFIDFGSIPTGTPLKFAARVNTNNSMDLFFNGVKGTSSANTTVIPIASIMTLGSVINTNALNGYEKNFKIYNTALTDQQLINLTR